MSSTSSPVSFNVSARRPCELQRANRHADQVRAVDALEALDDDRLDAEEQRSLLPPSRGDDPVPYFLAAVNQRHAALLYSIRGVVIA